MLLCSRGDHAAELCLLCLYARHLCTSMGSWSFSDLFSSFLGSFSHPSPYPRYLLPWSTIHSINCQMLPPSPETSSLKPSFPHWEDYCQRCSYLALLNGSHLLFMVLVPERGTVALKTQVVSAWLLWAKRSGPFFRNQPIRENTKKLLSAVVPRSYQSN